jgi:chromate transporter
MTFAAILIHFIESQQLSLAFTRFLQPIAVGFVAFAAFKITRKVVRSKTAFLLMLLSLVVSVWFNSPYIFPLLILIGAATTALKYKQQPKKEKEPLKIEWSNFILWGGVFIAAAILGAVTGSLAVRLFENFYRTGSLIFGGGQVLIPFLYAEFVELKQYLTQEEFLTGYALGQSIPGPTFSFVSYVGALSMQGYGIAGQLVGGFVAALGIFLPGTFLIFFVIRFWDALKKYRGVRASLEGVNAISSGMVIAAALLLFLPMRGSLIDIGIMLATYLLLTFTRIPAPYMIIAGLIAGVLINVA